MIKNLSLPQKQGGKKAKKGNNQATKASRPKVQSSVVRAAPAALSKMMKSGSPKVRQSGDTGTRVIHRELVLENVTGSMAFAVKSAIALNPGLPASFPWLSSVAKNYDQYRVHRLIAEWVPIAPSSTQGSVLLSPDYDATDPAPGSEQAAANHADSKSFSVWSTCTLQLDPNRLMGLGPRRFVRTGPVPYQDLKVSDVGNIFVSTNNFAADGTSAGKLYLSYDIEFFAPEVSNPQGAVSKVQATDSFQINDSGVKPVASLLVVNTGAPNAAPQNAGNVATGGMIGAQPALQVLKSGLYAVSMHGSVVDTQANGSSNIKIFLSSDGATPIPLFGTELSASVCIGTFLSIDTGTANGGNKEFSCSIVVPLVAGTLLLVCGQVLGYKSGATGNFNLTKLNLAFELME